MTIPSLDACLTVSKAIRKQGPRVDRDTYKTHVPEWVDAQGNIHPDVIDQAVREKNLPNKPFDHPINWTRFYDRRLEEITPGTCVRVGQQMMLGRTPNADDAAHLPDFLTPEGFVRVDCLNLLNY